MTGNNFFQNIWNSKDARLFILAGIALAALVILFPLISILTVVVVRAGLPASLPAFLNWLFGLTSVQIWWYITRASGIAAFIMLWLSTAWGLAVSSKIFDSLLHRAYTYDFHQFLSLLSLGFLFLHIAVLTLDHYLPFSIAQILVPFTSSYRPLWVGIGVIALYLTVLVTVTFYIRSWIGVKAFRWIHTLSLVAYLGATFHGLYSGTDSPLISMQILYKGSLLSVIFLTTYWLVALAMRRNHSTPHWMESEGGLANGD
jgi:predicted ferric reductase